MYIHLRKGHLRSDANSCRKAWLNYVALRLMPDNDIRIPWQVRQLDAHVSPLDNSRVRPPSCSARVHDMGGIDVSLKTEDTVITTCRCLQSVVTIERLPHLFGNHRRENGWIIEDWFKCIIKDKFYYNRQFNIS